MAGKFTPDVVQMLENIPNAFYALDKGLKFIYANKKIQELMRRDEAELLGKHIWEVFSATANTPLYNTLQSALENKEVSYLQEYYKPYDKWFELYAYPSEYGLAIYVNDITARKKNENHLVLLNKAGEYLSVTYDIEEAVDKVSKLIVPGFSDWFTVDWLKGDTVELMKMAHEDAEKVAWGTHYRNNSVIDLIHPKRNSVGWVVRMGIAIIVNDVDEELLQAAAQDAEHLQVLKALNIRSAMIAPMPCKGKNIGAVTFLSESKLYDDADFLFAKDIGLRIGVAIEHNRIFEDAKKELATRIQAQHQLAASYLPKDM